MSIVMVSGIVFGRPHLSFRPMNARTFLFKEAAGGVIVHCGVQAYVFHGKSSHIFSHFMESGEKADRIMPPYAGKAQEQRDVCHEFGVIAG